MGNILTPARPPPGGWAVSPDALRRLADEKAAERRAAVQASRAAYAAGDHAAAKAWSERGKAATASMAELNARAADAAFAANNAGRPPGEVDLHGLRVAEAVARAEAAIRAARARQESWLVLIVGRGLHSAGGVAKLKPALLDALAKKHSLRVTAGVPNDGCLLVEMVEPGLAGFVARLVDACVIC